MGWARSRTSRSILSPLRAIGIWVFCLISKARANRVRPWLRPRQDELAVRVGHGCLARALSLRIASTIAFGTGFPVDSSTVPATLQPVARTTRRALRSSGAIV